MVVIFLLASVMKLFHRVLSSHTILAMSVWIQQYTQILENGTLLDICPTERKIRKDHIRILVGDRGDTLVVSPTSAILLERTLLIILLCSWNESKPCRNANYLPMLT